MRTAHIQSGTASKFYSALTMITLSLSSLHLSLNAHAETEKYSSTAVHVKDILEAPTKFYDSRTKSLAAAIQTNSSLLLSDPKTEKLHGVYFEEKPDFTKNPAVVKISATIEKTITKEDGSKAKVTLLRSLEGPLDLKSKQSIKDSLVVMKMDSKALDISNLNIEVRVDYRTHTILVVSKHSGKVLRMFPTGIGAGAPGNTCSPPRAEGMACLMDDGNQRESGATPGCKVVKKYNFEAIRGVATDGTNYGNTPHIRILKKDCEPGKFCDTNYAFHGPITSSLQRGNVSHGCFRMRKADSFEFYALTKARVKNDEAVVPVIAGYDVGIDIGDHPYPRVSPVLAKEKVAHKPKVLASVPQNPNEHLSSSDGEVYQAEHVPVPKAQIPMEAIE